MNFTPELRKALDNAPKSAKDILAEILIESILSDSSIPEDVKIEVRLTKICREIGDAVHRIVEDYATPLPSFDPEGAEVRKKALPARQACLEYLQLMKGGLENFRQQVPAPDIPERFKEAVRRPEGL